MNVNGELLIRIDETIRGIAPIDGISIGKIDDMATWFIIFKNEATHEQRSAAQNALVTFDVVSHIKIQQKIMIDAAAESQRLRYITGGATKAMEYLEAKDQAVAVLGMGEAAANELADHGVAEFPVLSASVPTEAASLYAAAQLISARYEAYASKAGAIKRKVTEAKAAVMAAQTAPEAMAVLGAIPWP